MRKSKFINLLKTCYMSVLPYFNNKLRDFNKDLELTLWLYNHLQRRDCQSQSIFVGNGITFLFFDGNSTTMIWKETCFLRRSSDILVDFKPKRLMIWLFSTRGMYTNCQNRPVHWINSASCILRVYFASLWHARSLGFIPIICHILNVKASSNTDDYLKMTRKPWWDGLQKHGYLMFICLHRNSREEKVN